MTKSLIGSTQTLFYKFYSEATGDLSDLVDEALIVYDSNREIILNASPIRTGVGEYYYKLIIPNNPPHIYVECSGVVDGVKQCTRDQIECVWAENDINTLPATDIIVGTNSYIDLEDANEYMKELMKSNVWFNVAYTVRIKALKQATRTIDSLMFKGKKSDIDQPLSFPRNITNDIIPEALKQACCEEALSVVESINSPEASRRMELQRQGVIEVKFGDSAEKYSGSGSSKNSYNKLTISLLRPYMATIARIGG